MPPLYSQNPHWKPFFQASYVKYLESTIQEQWIDSANTKIHLDIYEVGRKAPTIIYCHGLSSCGRMMAHLVDPLYKMGYNIICPDLIGFGMTTEKTGSGTVAQFVQNLLDTIAYAKKRFKGPCYLTGISMGGALSYYTAAAGADVKAIACFCLMDLASPETWIISKQGKWVERLLPLLKLSSLLAPNSYLPLKHFLSADNIAPDSRIVELFKANELVIKQYTYKAACSLLTTKPQIPFDQFTRLPVLVLHAKDDKLIPESLSLLNYGKLACQKKYVSLKNCGHVPLHPATLQNYAQVLNEWFFKWS